MFQEFTTDTCQRDRPGLYRSPFLKIGQILAFFQSAGTFPVSRGMKDNNVKHLRGAPYHPSTNGLAERFVQSFKNAMKAAKTKDDLSLRITRFLLAYRNAPHAVTGEAPADLMLGRKLRSRLEMIRPDLRKKVEDNIKPPSKKLRDFEDDQNVMVRNYMSGPKWVHGTILRKSGHMSYDVLVG